MGKAVLILLGILALVAAWVCGLIATDDYGDAWQGPVGFAGFLGFIVVATACWAYAGSL